MLPVVQFTELDDFLDDVRYCPKIYRELLDMRVGGNSTINLSRWQTATILRAIVTDSITGTPNHISSIAIAHGQAYETVHGQAIPGYSKEEAIEESETRHKYILAYVITQTVLEMDNTLRGVIDIGDTKLLFAPMPKLLIVEDDDPQLAVNEQE